MVRFSFFFLLFFSQERIIQCSWLYPEQHHFEKDGNPPSRYRKHWLNVRHEAGIQSFSEKLLSPLPVSLWIWPRLLLHVAAIEIVHREQSGKAPPHGQKFHLEIMRKIRWTFPLKVERKTQNPRNLPEIYQHFVFINDT